MGGEGNACIWILEEGGGGWRGVCCLKNAFPSEKLEDRDYGRAGRAGGQQEAAAGARGGGGDGDERCNGHGVGCAEEEVEEGGA